MLSRVLLTVGTLAFAVAFSLLMLKGWRGRQRRQGDVPPPPMASGDARVVVAATPGLFVGTTVTGDWMDRVAVHHLSDRATAELVLATDGVHIDREGLPELFVPYEAVESAEIDVALAGKVVSGGMLALTWRLGPRVLTSGFRATDHAAHRRLADAITALLPVPSPAQEASS